MRGVSFVIPVYNKARYLKRVIGQIGRQTGDFAREYIFVDDGSTDDSLAVIRDATKTWSDVHVIEQANAGSAAATNVGIRAARRPFIKLVDADDLLFDDATECLLRAIKTTDAVMAWGQREFFKPDEADDLVFGPLDATGNPVIDPSPLQSVIRNSFCNPTQMLIRTGTAQDVGGCDERIVYSQEYSLTLRLARAGAFARIDRQVAWLLDDADGRLSINSGRQLQRVCRAVANLIADDPGVPGDVVRYACRRVAGRAWKYRHRYTTTRGVADPAFWRQFRWLLPIGDPVAFIESCAREFDSAGEAVIDLSSR